MKRILLYLSFLSATLQAYSQSPVFMKFNTNDGLSSSEVYHIIQDKKGYVWFATSVGVSRYDGYSFVSFSNDDGLPDNTVFDLFEDYKGRIWFVPISCKLSYYENGKIYEYKYNDILRKGLTPSNIPNKRSFRVDSLDNVSIAIYFKGLYKIDNKGNLSVRDNAGICESIYANNNCPYSVIYKMYNNHQIEVIDSDSFKYMINGDELQSSKGSSSGRSFAVKLKNNHIIYGRNNELAEFDKNGILKTRILPSFVIWMSLKRDGDLVVGTYKGVYFFKNAEISSEDFIHYLKDRPVSSVMEDSENGLWFSTLDDGVYYLPSENIVTYTTDDGLKSNLVNYIMIAPDGSAWANQYSGFVSRISDGKLTNFRISEKDDDVIFCSYYDKYYNRVWFGEGTDKLVAVDYKNFENNHNTIDENVIQIIEYANKFAAGHDDFFWMGNSFRLFKLKNDKLIYLSDSDNFLARIHAIYEDENQKLWIGTLKGLWQYDGDKYIDFGLKNELLKNRINAISGSGFNNKLILGTKEVGLLIYDFLNDSIYHITTKQGLVSNSISAITGSGNEYWIGTNKGISRIRFMSGKNPYNVNITSYTSKSGLIENEINHMAISDTLLYIATNKGISVMSTNYEEDRNFITPVYITGVNIAGIDTIVKPDYLIEYYQNNIAINYVGLAYKKLGNITYYYKLTGINDNWIKTNNPQVVFPFLPPGNYKFVVTTAPDKLDIPYSFASVSFVIKRPFWQAWWFYGLIGLFLLISAWVLFYLRMREVRKRSLLNQDMMKYRQQALSSQMNPHFIFNSLNSIQHFILQNDIRTSNKYLSKFSHLMRATLNNSQHQAIPLQDEIETLSLYLELESLRFKEKFEFSIHVDPEIKPLEIKIPTLLIQPYVENSIWHGLMHKDGTGRITVSVLKKENYFVCIVEDNGIGREKAMEIKKNKIKTHQSLGTKITEKRLDLLNTLYNQHLNVQYTDLFDNFGNASGTRVEITLPIIKE